MKGDRLLRWFLIWVGLIVGNVGQSQQYSFVHYGMEDGLPQSQVYDIAQDSLGYLWVATLGGVARYDGYEFETFTVQDGLISNEIHVIEVDKNGKVWFGGAGGISFFNGDSVVSIINEQEKSFLADRIVFINDRIWVLSDAGKVYILDEKSLKIRNWSSNQNLEFNDIGVFEDQTTYFLTNEGVFVWEDSTDTIIQLNQINNEIGLIDNNSIVYTGGLDGRIRSYNSYKLNQTVNEWTIGSFFQDLIVGKENEIWGATRKGIFRLREEKIKWFNQNNGLPFDNVRAVFSDRNENIWVGTYGGGLFRFSGELITTYTKSDGLGSDLVMAIDQDRLSNLYIATYDFGIYKESDLGFIPIDNNEEFTETRCWDLHIDSQQDVYVATSAGIYIDSKNGFNKLNRKNGLIDDAARTILEYDSLFWVGSSLGFSILQNQQVISNSVKFEYAGGKIRDIEKLDKYKTWFATSEGLLCFSNDSVFTYLKDEGIAASNSYCLEFAWGNMYVGTSSGLTKLENGKLNPSITGYPIDYKEILLLLFDQRGRLWVGTEDGIYTLKFVEEDQYEVEYYSKQDGLLGATCNMNAAYLDQEGNVFIGTETGLVRFDRKELEKKDHKPPLITELKDVQLFLEKIDWKSYSDTLILGKRIPQNPQLKPDDNYLTFTYSALNLSNPDEVEYRFMLEGAEGKLSEQWSAPTSNPFATFSNLESGTYTFKVQATRKGDDWPEYATTYPFTIITPYYATWWFRGLMGFLFIGFVSLIGLWRYSIVKQKRENQKLVDQSKMLALEQQTLNANMNRHFVFNSLNSIQYYFNKEDKYNANRYLSHFAKLIRKNLDSSQATFTTINEELERMELYLGLEQMRFKDQFTYKFEVDDDINTRKTKIPAMLFQPYLENSIWHGILPMDKPGKIDIKIHLKTADSLKIEIIDNGIGIATSLSRKKEDKKDHISKGMQITRSRMDLFKRMGNAQAYVIGPEEWSNNGQTAGTRVEMHLPLLTENPDN
jgi:ligand-binding sensor domain-containing protein